MGSLRRSFNSKWIKNSNGEVCGLDLGSDYCAEHEHGIERLQQYLGVSNINPHGIDSRRIKTRPSDNYFYIVDEVKKKKTGVTAFIIGDSYYISQMKETKKLPSDLKPLSAKGERSNLICAWGESGFAIIASKDEDRKNLRDLILSFELQDLAVWLGGGGAFCNAGLVLGMIDKVDQSDKDYMMQADKENKELKLADLATGIREILEKKGKKYYALSPNWSNKIKSTDRGEIKTSYPVIYFLNPMSQGLYNYGWFTVEDLMLWADNKGPIMKVNQKTG